MRWRLVKRSTFFGLEKSQFSLVVAEALHDALSDAPNGRCRQKGGGLQTLSVKFSSRMEEVGGSDANNAVANNNETNDANNRKKTQSTTATIARQK